ncbi:MULTISPECIES: (d)CMP kinase [Pedobacter]|uniref:(d)CMP kinase n=1 Tax=Pedobacter TaxID=84567 RepID=UPI00210AD198|nr:MULTISPECIES: (d)CMP kinase [unclassified Pedobacter]
MRTNLIIAIDGYSSCGKSTLAKALAKRLNFIYIDSGAMYRAVTLFFLRNNVDVADLAQVQNALGEIEINFHSRDYDSHISLNGEDVSEEIRGMRVSESVSEVSAHKAVRNEMVKQQQRMGKFKNVVMDGRDIGTTVFPDAQLKLFMTADPKVRAERRYREMQAKGDTETTLEEVFENLAHRDYADTTRAESPLTRAQDAVILDNTTMTEKEQLEFALEEVHKHFPV